MEQVIIGARVNERQLANSAASALRAGAAAATPMHIKASFPTGDLKKMALPLGRITGDLNQFQGALDASVARVLAFGASASVLAGVASALRGIVEAGIEVEKSLADINSILKLSSSSLAEYGSKLFDVARNTATSFKETATAALELSRQGLNAEETIKRLNDALILARLTGMDTTTAVSSLTAAVNGFSKEGINSTEIINRLASVETRFAVSAKDLAEALSRAGAVSQDAGVQFNELISIVTAVQQQTARGGAVIGNGFKSIFTRIQRSEVRETLESIGVATSDSSGAFRGAIPILRDYARVYQGLSDTEKSSTAEKIAGVFQINTLKAALNDLNKEYSVYSGALGVANSATDEAQQRNEQLNKTTAALLTNTTTSLKEFGAALSDLAANEGLRNVLTIVDTVAKKMADFLDEEKGSAIAKALVGGLGNFIAGPGLAIVGIALFKLLKFLTSEVAMAFKQIQNLNIGKQQQLKTEAAIGSVLVQNEDLLLKIVANEGNRLVQQELILGAIKQQEVALKQVQIIQRAISNAAATGVYAVAPKGGVVTKRGAASGFVPNFASPRMGASTSEKVMETMSAYHAGYKAGNVYNTRIHDGTGRSFISTVNGAEDITTVVGPNGQKGTFVTPPTAARGYIPNYAGLSSLTPKGSRYSDFKEILSKGGNVKGQFRKPFGSLTEDEANAALRRARGTENGGLAPSIAKRMSERGIQNEVVDLGFTKAISMILAKQGGVRQVSGKYKEPNGPAYKVGFKSAGMVFPLRPESVDLQKRLGDYLVRFTNAYISKISKDGGKIRSIEEFSNKGSLNSMIGTVFETAITKGFQGDSATREGGASALIDFVRPTKELRKLFHNVPGVYEAKWGEHLADDVARKAILGGYTSIPATRSRSGQKFKTAASGHVPNFYQQAQRFYDWDGTIIPEIKGGAGDYIKNLRNLRKQDLLPIGKMLANSGKPFDVATARSEYFRKEIEDAAKRLGLNVKKVFPLDTIYAGQKLSRPNQKLKFIESQRKMGFRSRLIDNDLNNLSSLGKYGVNANRMNGILARRGFAEGFSPSGALSEAVEREVAAGIPTSAIRINKSARLRNSRNPAGLAVTNTLDEPRGLSDVFANGYVPNFAPVDIKGYGQTQAIWQNLSRGGLAAAQSLITLASIIKQEQGARARYIQVTDQGIKSQAALNSSIQKIYTARTQPFIYQTPKFSQRAREFMGLENKPMNQADEASMRYSRIKAGPSGVSSETGGGMNRGMAMMGAYFAAQSIASGMSQRGGRIGAAGEAISGGLNLGYMISMFGKVNPMISVAVGGLYAAGKALWEFQSGAKEAAKKIENITESNNKNSQAATSYISKMEELNSAMSTGDTSKASKVRDELNSILSGFDNKEFSLKMQEAGSDLEKLGKIAGEEFKKGQTELLKAELNKSKEGIKDQDRWGGIFGSLWSKEARNKHIEDLTTKTASGITAEKIPFPKSIDSMMDKVWDASIGAKNMEDRTARDILANAGFSNEENATILSMIPNELMDMTGGMEIIRNILIDVQKTQRARAKGEEIDRAKIKRERQLSVDKQKAVRETGMEKIVSQFNRDIVKIIRDSNRATLETKSSAGFISGIETQRVGMKVDFRQQMEDALAKVSEISSPISEAYTERKFSVKGQEKTDSVMKFLSDTISEFGSKMEKISGGGTIDTSKIEQKIADIESKQLDGTISDELLSQKGIFEKILSESISLNNETKKQSLLFTLQLRQLRMKEGLDTATKLAGRDVFKREEIGTLSQNIQGILSGLTNNKDELSAITGKLAEISGKLGGGNIYGDIAGTAESRRGIAGEMAEFFRVFSPFLQGKVKTSEVVSGSTEIKDKTGKVVGIKGEETRPLSKDERLIEGAKFIQQNLNRMSTEIAQAANRASVGIESAEDILVLRLADMGNKIILGAQEFARASQEEAGIRKEAKLLQLQEESSALVERYYNKKQGYDIPVERKGEQFYVEKVREQRATELDVQKTLETYKKSFSSGLSGATSEQFNFAASRTLGVEIQSLSSIMSDIAKSQGLAGNLRGKSAGYIESLSAGQMAQLGLGVTRTQAERELNGRPADFLKNLGTNETNRNLNVLISKADLIIKAIKNIKIEYSGNLDSTQKEISIQIPIHQNISGSPDDTEYLEKIAKIAKEAARLASEAMPGINSAPVLEMNYPPPKYSLSY